MLSAAATIGSLALPGFNSITLSWLEQHWSLLSCGGYIRKANQRE